MRKVQNKDVGGGKNLGLSKHVNIILNITQYTRTLLRQYYPKLEKPQLIEIAFKAKNYIFTKLFETYKCKNQTVIHTSDRKI